MEVSPYFDNVPPEAWRKPGFMVPGYVGYRWRANLVIVEKSVDTYGPVKVARSISILNEDTYAKIFPQFLPEMWKFAHLPIIPHSPAHGNGL